jgi:hypothetical protein
MWFLLYVNVCPWVPYEFSSGRAQFPAHSPRCFTSAKELTHLEASLFLHSNETFGSSGAIGLFGQNLGFIGLKGKLRGNLKTHGFPVKIFPLNSEFGIAEQNYIIFETKKSLLKKSSEPSSSCCFTHGFSRNPLRFAQNLLLDIHIFQDTLDQHSGSDGWLFSGPFSVKQENTPSRKSVSNQVSTYYVYTYRYIICIIGMIYNIYIYPSKHIYQYLVCD